MNLIHTFRKTVIATAFVFFASFLPDTALANEIWYLEGCIMTGNATSQGSLTRIHGTVNFTPDQIQFSTNIGNFTRQASLGGMNYNHPRKESFSYMDTSVDPPVLKTEEHIVENTRAKITIVDESTRVLNYGNTNYPLYDSEGSIDLRFKSYEWIGAVLTKHAVSSRLFPFDEQSIELWLQPDLYEGSNIMFETNHVIPSIETDVISKQMTIGGSSLDGFFVEWGDEKAALQLSANLNELHHDFLDTARELVGTEFSAFFPGGQYRYDHYRTTDKGVSRLIHLGDGRIFWFQADVSLGETIETWLPLGIVSPSRGQYIFSAAMECGVLEQKLSFEAAFNLQAAPLPSATRRAVAESVTINAGSPTPKAALVKILRGEVYEVFGGVERLLKVNDWVRNGSVVKTGEKSFVKLVFLDRSQMNVGPSSEMRVEDFSGKDSGIIDFIKGEIRSQVTKDYLRMHDRKKSKLFIKTSNAVMGVRGTEFEIFYSEGQDIVTTQLQMVEGSVEFTNLLTGVTTLVANQDLIAAQGAISDPGFAGPEITVLGPTLQSFTSGVSVQSLGAVAPLSSSEPMVFRIRNIGQTALTGVMPVIQGVHAADFSIVKVPEETLSPLLGEGTLQIVFTPSALGSRQAELRIASSDQDESPFVVHLEGAGTGVVPEIAVSGNGLGITSGDTTPREADYSDFGFALLEGDPISRTFTITNSGIASLNLTGTPSVTLSGTHATDFMVTTQPTSPVLAGGGTTTVTLQFKPSALGIRSAMVSLANDDSDESPYIFAIQGTGIDSQIVVTGQGTEIVSGDLSPSPNDGTDFGGVGVLDTRTKRTFTIMNNGTAPLNLSGMPRVAISGAAAADFTVTAQPISPVAIGASIRFEITFDPALPGLRTALVSISNDDPQASPYTFAIGGFGTVALTQAQTIAFTPPLTVYLGQSVQALRATASSGLPVTLTLVSGPATLTNGTLALNAAGTLKVTATQTGGSNFAAAAPVTRLIVVKADPTTLTLLNLAQVYDGTPKPITTGGTDGSVVITYKVGTAYVLTAPTNAGSYAVKAVVGTVIKTGTLVIAKATLTVTPDDKRKFAGQANPVLSSMITGFRGSDTASAVTKPIVLTTTATPGSAGGQYPIRSSGGAAANYAFNYQQGTLVVESFAGSYEALLVDSGGLPIGKLSLTVSATSKTFTAKLASAATTSAVSFTGALATANEQATGTATTNVVTNKISTPYSINFTLPLYGNVTASATIGGSAVGSATDGQKLSTSKVPYAGAHTVVLEPATPADVGVPAGAGWATAAIGTSGVMTIAGRLGDGTTFTSTVSPDGLSDPGYRVFVQPYLAARTQSFLAGAFSLEPHPTLANRRIVAAAGMTWKKVGLPTDGSYRSGFGPVNTLLMLDPWQVPVAATRTAPAITLTQRLGLSVPNFAVSHSGTGSSSQTNLPTSLTLSATNAVSVLAPLTVPTNSTKWKTTLYASNGTFTGTFELQDGAQKRPVTFTGVLRQPSAASDKLIGDGHYLLPPLTGAASTEKRSGEVMFMQP